MKPKTLFQLWLPRSDSYTATFASGIDTNIFMSFEDIGGSNGNDEITGNISSNVLYGHGGDDALYEP